jgi:transposase
MLSRKAYPTDVSGEEWAFVAPYLCLMREDAPQREHSLREVYNALRYLVRAGCPWRLLPNDLPPYGVVFQQAQRWIKAGAFGAMAHDLRAILRLAVGRNEEPTAIVLDARTLQSSVESGSRAGYDGHKRKKGSKVHLAVDTLGHLLALHVTAANEQERAQAGELAAQVQEFTGQSVELAYVDQGLHGRRARQGGSSKGH